MKKKLKVIFAVASGLLFVGLVVTGWVAFFFDSMGSPIMKTLMLIFWYGFGVCLTIFAVLMLSDCDPNEGGGSIRPDGPGIPW